ncbi:hypothetical protein HG531_011732 [Fusarium graminearum]|nr:hypothetical protein HG531_011732 [Fusarium graminearum]
MLVPRVLGDIGILPVVALVACETQSPEQAPDTLPSVVSLDRCFAESLLVCVWNGSLFASSLTASNVDTDPSEPLDSTAAPFTGDGPIVL